MKKPVLLDLFCGGGGASWGYHLAGFDVVGVDIEPQPRYPFAFVRADAIEYCREYGDRFDMIHASPPCQSFSRVRNLAMARNGGKYPEYPDLISETREVMQEKGKPYVIENVVGAPLIHPIMLCGSMFPELRVYRHRLFECSVTIRQPEHRPHNDRTPSAGNGPSPKGFISVCGSGGVRGMTSEQIIAYWRKAMGIHWMNRRELAESIPPAYTEFIGNKMRNLI